jgi:hypothetical protein
MMSIDPQTTNLTDDEWGERFFIALIRYCQARGLPGITIQYPTQPSQYVTVPQLQSIYRSTAARLR